MRPERSAEHILSITRAKAKMYEYAVPLEDHIDLTTNPNVLFSLAMGLVGDAAAAIASGRPDDPLRSSSLKAIRFAATFFDAYIDAQLDERVRDEFALLAACSYYLADLPGNARLLVSRIAEPSEQGADGLDWLTFKLLRSSFDLADNDIAQRRRLAAALLSLTARGGPETLLEATQKLRSEAYDGGDGRAVLYGDLVAAISKRRLRTLLAPFYLRLPILQSRCGPRSFRRHHLSPSFGRLKCGFATLVCSEAIRRSFRCPQALVRRARPN
jgi:POLQ-like helicase